MGKEKTVVEVSVEVKVERQKWHRAGETPQGNIKRK